MSTCHWELPQLPTGSRGSQTSIVPFLILKCSCFSSSLRLSPSNTSMHDADRFQLCCYIYTCICMNIYTHRDTSKLCVWDIPHLTTSNVFTLNNFKHTFTKNTLKLFITAAEGKANAKDKERQRKQSGCVWCQDCWQETAFFLSHMPVILLLVLLHDQRTFQESQLDRYSMPVAGNSRKQSHPSQQSIFFRNSI